MAKLNDQLALLQAQMGAMGSAPSSASDIQSMLADALMAQSRAQNYRTRPIGNGAGAVGHLGIDNALAHRQEQRQLDTLKEAYAAQQGVDEYNAQVQAIQAKIDAIEEEKRARRKTRHTEKTKARFRDDRTSQQKNYDAWANMSPEERANFEKFSGGQTINISPDGGNKWTDKRHELAIDENQALYTAGMSARNDVLSYDMGLRLLDRVGTGKLSEEINEAKKFANALGGDFDAQSIADFEGLSPIFGELTMKRIQQTKGAVSNKEMDLFKRMNANYEYSTEGNRRLLMFAKAQAERDVEIRNLIGRMRKDGASPMDISSAVDEYVEKNDLSDIIADLVGGAKDPAQMSNQELLDNL